MIPHPLRAFVPLFMALALILLITALPHRTTAQQAPAPTPAPAPAPTPAPAADTQPSTQPSVQAASPIDAGRYLIKVGGCNDCHTPRFMETGGDVPESEWLTGLHVGFRGPWGTTYGSNLRTFVKVFVEDDFVKVLRARTTRPPMPWTALHAMSDQDLRALYKYIKSLTPVGKPAPAYVPPGVEPKTPYFLLDPSLTPKAFGTTMPATTQPTTPTKP